MILVQCPHCERRYRTKTEVMGRPAVCSRCRKPFKIGDARPPFNWNEARTSLDSWIGVEPPEEKEELKHCIMCDAPLPPGDFRCPECGVNQLTGLVQKGRYTPSEVGKPSLWAHIPLNWVLGAAVALVVCLGIYWFFGMITGVASKAAGDLANQALVAPAIRFSRDGGDDIDFLQQFGGQINDSNLDRVLPLLNSPDAVIARAAMLLIGYGLITDVQPLVEMAETEGTSSLAMRVLRTIGPRRLAELSVDSSPAIRRSAALALCMVVELERDSETLRILAEPVPLPDRIRLLNERCRPRPNAVGRFAVVVARRRAPLIAEIEQVGNVFYMRLGNAEFRTSVTRQRTFEIPIEHWCAATGSGVDATAVRPLLAGTVVLQSPLGVGWQGSINLTAKQQIADRLPGFLPIPPPEPGRTMEIEVALER